LFYVYQFPHILSNYDFTWLDPTKILRLFILRNFSRRLLSKQFDKQFY
jgi:hypothetical protein